MCSLQIVPVERTQKPSQCSFPSRPLSKSWQCFVFIQSSVSDTRYPLLIQSITTLASFSASELRNSIYTLSLPITMELPSQKKKRMPTEVLDQRTRIWGRNLFLWDVWIHYTDTNDWKNVRALFNEKGHCEQKANVSFFSYHQRKNWGDSPCHSRIHFPDQDCVGFTTAGTSAPGLRCWASMLCEGKNFSLANNHF